MHTRILELQVTQVSRAGEGGSRKAGSRRWGSCKGWAESMLIPLRLTVAPLMSIPLRLRMNQEELLLFAKIVEGS